MRVRIFTVIAASLLLCANAQADLQFGVKTGKMVIDQPGVGDPTNFSGTIGYELGVVVGDLAVEAELSRTQSAGNASGQDVEVDATGLFVTFTTAGPIYFKARGGVIDSELKVGNTSTSSNSGSVGAGLGFSLGLVRLEVEFTKIDDDINYLTLGVQF